MDNLIYLNSYVPNLKFVKDTVIQEVKNPRNNEIVTSHRVVIKIKNIDNGRSQIHRYTDFLSKWRNKKYNTVSRVADTIIPFLNYITFELPNSELSSAKELSFDIGVKYLETYSVGKDNNTVLYCDRIITEFYYFLANRNLLNNIFNSDFTFIETSNYGIKIKSPFMNKYTISNKQKEERLHHLDKKLLIPFVEMAMKYTPEIALGIYFQIFGGLRAGEVVNLTYSAISFSMNEIKKGVVLNLMDRNLRPDIKNKGQMGCVKKPRKQVVIIVPELFNEIYSSHKNRYKVSSTDAIFIDTTGKPMSKASYCKRFDKLKEKFIEELKNSDQISLKMYGNYLCQQKWNSHIGRGLFSNLVADVANTATEIALWRGDSSLDSSLAYISDSEKLEEKVKSNLKDMYDRITD